ncbi:MAG: hypothetical protein ACP5JB_05655 [candidate division WOR-3 bacterium]|jgi:hypothetical protein
MSGPLFNYKDIFRALRLGFSAKKVGMLTLGLLFGFAGYTILTYLAHLVAGNDWISVWETFRLLPFPSPNLPFPWFSWLIYGLGVLWLLLVLLITGAAVSKVTFEQLRGNEFYEAGEAFRFALNNAGAIIGSPLLLIAFILVLVIAGLILSAVGSIPYIGPLLVGILAIPAFFASLFIVYLLIVLLWTLFLGPSVVGAMGNDTFDTLFEIFSCINEQPARLIWFTAVLGFLAKLGSLLLGLASSLAVRIGSLILSTFMGGSYSEMLTGVSFIFQINVPSWGLLSPLHRLLVWEMNLYGIKGAMSPLFWESTHWGIYLGAVLLSVCAYGIAVLVLAYGLSVWYSGNVALIGVLVKKKDDKNIYETKEEEPELQEPQDKQLKYNSLHQ